jgi:hypothetical protein
VNDGIFARREHARKSGRPRVLRVKARYAMMLSVQGEHTMSAKSYASLVSLIFLALAGFQATRAYLAWPVQINEFSVPVNWSWAIAAVALLLSLLGVLARR